MAHARAALARFAQSKKQARGYVLRLQNESPELIHEGPWRADRRGPSLMSASLAGCGRLSARHTKRSRAPLVSRLSSRSLRLPCAAPDRACASAANRGRQRAPRTPVLVPAGRGSGAAREPACEAGARAPPPAPPHERLRTAPLASGINRNIIQEKEMSIILFDIIKTNHLEPESIQLANLAQWNTSSRIP